MSKILSLTFLIFALYAQIAIAHIVKSEEYGYLQSDPLKATIGSSVLYNGFTPSKSVEVDVYHRQIPGTQSLQKLQVSYYPALSMHPNARKLVHVISGLGGNGMNAIPLYLVNLFHRQGYSVVVYPNSLTENFSSAASKKGLVGAAATDAEDLYVVMKKTRDQLTDAGNQFEENLLLGYSHGALLAAFTHEIDESSREFNFTRTLLINPPVDLLHGVRVLDSFSRQYGFSFLRKITAGLRLRNSLRRHRYVFTTDFSQNGVYASTRLTSRESRGLIGHLLMGSLSETIVASQDVFDLGILPPGHHLSAARGIDFEAYVTNFYSALAKREGRDFSIDELNAQNSLTKLEASLESSRNIFVMHNADDFLLAPGDVEWLDRVLGDRSLIYPRGGHMGNLYYRDNVESILRWLNEGTLVKGQ